MTLPALVLVVTFASSAFMTGLIWFVQVVHYPLFGFVGNESFERYEQSHVDRTGRVVGPIMLVELLSGIWLVATPPPYVSRAVAVTALAILIALWLSTALVQVPAHRKLSGGFDGRIHARLVRTNLLRAVLWSGRTLLLGVVTLRGLG